MFYRSRLVQTVLSKWRDAIITLKKEQEDRIRIDNLLAEVSEV